MVRMRFRLCCRVMGRSCGPRASGPVLLPTVICHAKLERVRVKRMLGALSHRAMGRRAADGGGVEQPGLPVGSPRRAGTVLRAD